MDFRTQELIDSLKKIVTVLEVDLYSNTGLYGAFKQDKNGKPFIFIDQNQPEIDKKVIIVEEFKHMMTSYGVILNQDNLNNRVQENKARNQAYKELVTTEDLYEAYSHGLETEYELAEYLDLPQEFLHNAINYLKESNSGEVKLKNGIVVTFGDTIRFKQIS